MVRQSVKEVLAEKKLSTNGIVGIAVFKNLLIIVRKRAPKWPFDGVMAVVGRLQILFKRCPI